VDLGEKTDRVVVPVHLFGNHVADRVKMQKICENMIIFMSPMLQSTVAEKEIMLNAYKIGGRGVLPLYLLP